MEVHIQIHITQMNEHKTPLSEVMLLGFCSTPHVHPPASSPQKCYRYILSMVLNISTTLTVDCIVFVENFMHNTCIYMFYVFRIFMSNKWTWTLNYVCCLKSQSILKRNVSISNVWLCPKGSQMCLGSLKVVERRFPLLPIFGFFHMLYGKCFL